MPSIDVSLPKIKSPDVDISLEGPDVEGGKVSIPSVDIPLPKGKVEGDINVEGPEVKGSKFKVPNLDVSIPKVNLPESNVQIKSPDIKGRTTEMPGIDISLPKGETEAEIEIDGHAGKDNKFHMPAIDISLPKMKAKGPEINFEAPEVKGGKLNMPSLDVSLPKMKSPDVDISLEGPDVKGGKVNMLPVDISLPKGKAKGDIDVEHPEIKGGKFTMPKFEVSLPKVSLPKVDANVEGTDLKGKIELPTVNISPPKGKAVVEMDIHEQSSKGTKFHMPSLDISLPKIKAKGRDVDIEGPKVEGQMSLPKINSPEVDVSIQGPEIKEGKLSLPAVDISLPKGEVDADLNIEGPDIKSGKFKMPKFDVSLPKVNLPEANVEIPTDLDISGLKGDINPAKLKIDDEDIVKGGVEGPGASIKLPSMKLPSVDISAPKVDLDIGLTKPKGDDVEVELLKAEGSRPSSGGSFELPDVSLKFPSFSLPRFGAKSKSGDLQISGKGPKGDTSLSVPHVEGEIRAPSVEFDGDGKVKVKKPKIKMPSLGISKKNADGEVDAKLEVDVGGKGSIDVKMPSLELSFPASKTPETEVLLPKGEVDVSEADLRGYEGNLKIPKIPTLDISIPKLDLDVSLPKIKHGTKVDGEGNKLKISDIKMPDIDLALPKEKIGIETVDTEVNAEGRKFKMPHINMPDVDISLPTGTSPKIKGPEVEIGGEGTFEMPQITMPSVDVSLCKGKFGDLGASDIEINGDEGSKIRLPHVKMPHVDINLPKTNSVAISLPKGKIEGKFKIPEVDISRPKVKIDGPEMDIKGKGGRVKMPHLSMPLVDISFRKGKVEGPDVEIKGGSGRKFKMPEVDISLPKGKIESPEVELIGEDKYKMPNAGMSSVDILLPKGKVEGPDVDVEGGARGKFLMPHWKMTDVEISLPEAKIEAPDIEIKKESKGKFKIPNVPDVEGMEMQVEARKSEVSDITMPTVEIPLAKGKTEMKGDGVQFKMPDVDFSFPKGKTNVDALEVKLDAEGGTMKRPKIKMPKVDISLPKGKVKDIDTTIDMEVTEENVKSPSAKFPKVNMSVPKAISGEVEIKLPTAEAGRKVKGPQVTPSDVDINLASSKPKQGTTDYSEVDLHVEGEHKGPKIKMPTIDTKVPKGDLELDIGLHSGEAKKDRKKVELPDLDLNTAGTNSKIKGPKVKGTKFKIGKPKKKTDKAAGAKIEYDIEVETRSGQKEGKEHINIAVPQATLPNVQGSANIGTRGEGVAQIKVPSIPDIEFDIGTSQDEDDERAEKGKKIKIPKFGIPLPSISTPEGRMDIYGPEINYEGPKMPKVKKAESQCDKVKMPKIKMKPSFGKSLGNSVAVNTEWEVEDKLKGEKVTTHHVSFSLDKSGSPDATGSSSSPNSKKDASPQKGFNDNKQAFSGQIRLPKVEFTSHYGKMTAEKEEMIVKLEKDSSPSEDDTENKGLEVYSSKVALGDSVSPHARTDILDSNSAESPTGLNLEFGSTRVQAWSEVESKNRESEDKECSPWFKVPKFTLKPHSTGKNT
uniref:AHNAK nucleoprotein n=1 Tax=Mola mola TaxID=94237 RepID=A0A3Q3VY41_MOLML